MILSYDEPVWRPPSEARSLIVQATLGCSHNRCSFCHMYRTKRFRVRPMADILAFLDAAAARWPQTRRIFLADGDAAVLSTEKMLSVLAACRQRFSALERVTCYATPQNLLKKTVEDLQKWRQAGLTMMYLGVESGLDEVLESVDKGVCSDQIVEAGQKARRAGIVLSTTVILGLAGPELSADHARATGAVLSRIDPEFASALTLMLPDPDMLAALGMKGPSPEDTPALRMSPWDLIRELRDLVAAMDVTACTFRSNHASNYLPVRATLPQDRDSVLTALEKLLTERDSRTLRPESWRGL